jgi:hypothetical protein
MNLTKGKIAKLYYTKKQSKKKYNKKKYRKNRTLRKTRGFNLAKRSLKHVKRGGVPVPLTRTDITQSPDLLQVGSPDPLRSMPELQPDTTLPEVNQALPVPPSRVLPEVVMPSQDFLPGSSLSTEELNNIEEKNIIPAAGVKEIELVTIDEPTKESDVNKSEEVTEEVTEEDNNKSEEERDVKEESEIELVNMMSPNDTTVVTDNPVVEESKIEPTILSTPQKDDLSKAIDTIVDHLTNKIAAKINSSPQAISGQQNGFESNKLAASSFAEGGGKKSRRLLRKRRNKSHKKKKKR